MTESTTPKTLRLAAVAREYKHLFIEEVANAFERMACELERLHAVEQEAQRLRAENETMGSALADIASGEIVREHCVGPHCTEELGLATADEMSSRAAGALSWIDAARASTPQAS